MTWSAPIQRRRFCLTIGLLPLPGVVAAQPRDTPILGLLNLGSPPSHPGQRAALFRAGMEALGWHEGRDLRYEHRFAAGLPRRLEPLAAELVGIGAKVLVAFGSEASLAARRATATVPIVMLAFGDPSDVGLIGTLGRPAGNMTGVTMMMDAVVLKQLELLEEAVPGVRRVTIVHGGLAYEQVLVASLAAPAARLRVTLADRAVRSEADLPALFEGVSAQALVVLANPVLNELRGRIAELAIAKRIPAIGPWAAFAGAGFLFAYAPSVSEMHRRAASYADRILKGASPAELPIEQPTRFELTVNRTTAWALDLDLPAAILARADEVLD
jgi:putative ABC transport system substrate-binding protein